VAAWAPAAAATASADEEAAATAEAVYVLTVQDALNCVKDSLSTADTATVSGVLSWLSDHLGVGLRTPLSEVLTSSSIRGWVWRSIIILAQVHSLQSAAGCGMAFLRSLLSLLQMQQVQDALGPQACLELHVLCIESKALNWAMSASPAADVCGYPMAKEGATPSQQQGGVEIVASTSDGLGECTADKVAVWRSIVELVERAFGWTTVRQVRVQYFIGFFVAVYMP
jgi:hypothetical protein